MIRLALPLLAAVGCQSTPGNDGTDTGDTPFYPDPGSTGNPGVVELSGHQDRIDQDVLFELGDPFQNDYGYTIALDRIDVNLGDLELFGATNSETMPLGLFSIAANRNDEAVDNLGSIEVPAYATYDSYELDVPRGGEGCSLQISGSWLFDDDDTSGDIDICVSRALRLFGPFYIIGESPSIWATPHAIDTGHHGDFAEIKLTVNYDGGERELTDYNDSRPVPVRGLFNGVDFNAGVSSVSTQVAQNAETGGLLISTD